MGIRFERPPGGCLLPGAKAGSRMCGAGPGDAESGQGRKEKPDSPGRSFPVRSETGRGSRVDMGLSSLYTKKFDSYLHRFTSMKTNVAVTL
ncbi:hypothetical protein TRIP_B220019 [uncultured Desulfatiglans sp.]|nr:hypothetical protein TRIP_B220019 [uncultured Desulfatiglans sp.]